MRDIPNYCDQVAAVTGGSSSTDAVYCRNITASTQLCVQLTSVILLDSNNAVTEHMSEENGCMFRLNSALSRAFNLDWEIK
jgi:hypothetical protein